MSVLKRLRYLIPLALIVLLIGLAVTLLDIGELVEILRGARWGYLIPSSLINVLTLSVVILRWRTLLQGRASFLDCWAANQIGAYANVFLPFRLGDLARSTIIRRHIPDLSWVGAMSSIGAELTFEMAVLMVLVGLLLFALPLPALLTSAALPLTILTVFAAVGMLSLGRGGPIASRLIWPLLRRIPGRLGALAVGFAERIQDGLGGLRDNRQLLQILALTILGYGLQIVSNTLLLRAFWDDATLTAGLMALVGAGIGLALPLLPGSAGTYQLAVTLALSSLGAEPEVAAAFALILHAQQVVMTLIMGSLAMLREGVSRRDLTHPQTLPYDDGATG